MNFVIPFAFPMLVDAIGSGPTFFIFAAFCVLALIFTITLVPETKGKSLAEIQKLLQ